MLNKRRVKSQRAGRELKKGEKIFWILPYILFETYRSDFMKLNFCKCSEYQDLVGPHIFFFFWSPQVAFEILLLIPQPGMEIGSPAAESQSPNH